MGMAAGTVAMPMSMRVRMIVRVIMRMTVMMMVSVRHEAPYHRRRLIASCYDIAVTM